MRKSSLMLVGVIWLGILGYTQIQVSQEPRHHRVFENEWVRILDVRIPPRDTTLMHKHSTPSVFVILNPTKTGSEALVEPGRSASTDASIWFEGFYAKPRIHRVWNEDTVEFHVMDIELLHGSITPPSRTPRQQSSNDSIQIPYSRLLFDERPVRGYKVDLGAGRGFKVNTLAGPVLVVGLSGPAADGAVNGQRFTKKGDFLFIPAGMALNITNGSVYADYQFAVFLLK